MIKEEFHNLGLISQKHSMKLKHHIKIVASLIHKFGLLKSIMLYIRIGYTYRFLKEEHYGTYNKARVQLGKNASSDLLYWSSLYLEVSRLLGQADAYEYIKENLIGCIVALEKKRSVVHNQASEATEFKQFKERVVASFEALSKVENIRLSYIYSEENRLIIKMKDCIICKLFNQLGVPELAKLACEYDYIGYKSLESLFNYQFKKLQSIGYGDDQCMIEFTKVNKERSI